ncbi:MAG: hypothetical protein Q8R43_01360 [Alphaproteobacteria bacterium]|nr:hypothetical protein [Alphaproteobacteria bacterium]
MHLILKRRLNYNRRMECKYRIVHVDSDPSLVLEEWIPEFQMLNQENVR